METRGGTRRRRGGENESGQAGPSTQDGGGAVSPGFPHRPSTYEMTSESPCWMTNTLNWQSRVLNLVPDLVTKCLMTKLQLPISNAGKATPALPSFIKAGSDVVRRQRGWELRFWQRRLTGIQFSDKLKRLGPKACCLNYWTPFMKPEEKEQKLIRRRPWICFGHFRGWWCLPK